MILTQGWPQGHTDLIPAHLNKLFPASTLEMAFYCPQTEQDHYQFRAFAFIYSL